VAARKRADQYNSLRDSSTGGNARASTI